ncbi:MAG: dihydropteroate synthase [Dehalococcoidia bacterium]|nr:dihydropteroate synthase [Dehalococcoidia bacterium]MDW8119051.1 dihydropteroate synthase [Chloroflexota bacterium]
MLTHTANLGTTVIGGRPFRWGARTYIMGILNLSPESFSGDGLADVEAAVQRALAMEAEGADIIDVGGESSRPPTVYPDARPIPLEEELRRVIPVIRRLARVLQVPISIDTSKAEVARQAIAEGASLVNDVWGFTADPNMARVVAQAKVPAVLTHNQHGYEYQDLIPDIIRGLQERVQRALEAGVAREHLIVDPGWGFGKRAEQNLEVLRRLGDIRSALQRPLLIGTSRKHTIGLVLGLPVHERLEGTAATVALAIAQGADIVRVHDVKAMVRVARMADAVVRGWRRPEGG